MCVREREGGGVQVEVLQCHRSNVSIRRHFIHYVRWGIFYINSQDSCQFKLYPTIIMIMIMIITTTIAIIIIIINNNVIIIIIMCLCKRCV